MRKGEDTVVIETGGDRSKLRIRIEAVQENLTAQEEAAKEKKEKQNAKLTPGAPKKEKPKKEKSESEEYALASMHMLKQHRTWRAWV